MPYGLKDIELAKLNEVFAANERIECVVLYGSRAKGNYKPFSDVDITLEGAGLTLTDLSRLSLAIDDLLLPYLFDISIFHTLKNEALIDHIHRMGITIYEKKSEWKEYKLGEVITVKYGKDHKALKDGLYPVYGSGGIMRYADNFLYDKESILIPRKGSLNNIFYREKAFWTVDTMFYSEIDTTKVFPKFLFYQLKLVDFENLNVGSAVPSLTIPIINDIDISLPPLPEQIRIASILSSLDDKIDLLHRENKTLEAMAETLFRQWFIEEAKEDWEEKPLSFYGKIICGKTPPKKENKYFGGEIPFIKIPDMHNKTFVFTTEDTLTIDGKLYQLNKTLPPFSIVVSCIATVGLVVLNAKESQTNQQINTIIPYKEEYRYYLYLKIKNMYEELNAMASGGTATLNLNTSDFSKIEVLYPPINILNEFHFKVRPLFDKIYNNQEQIQTLIQQRDGFLPKLMSGEVKI